MFDTEDESWKLQVGHFLVFGSESCLILQELSQVVFEGKEDKGQHSCYIQHKLDEPDQKLYGPFLHFF